MVIHKIKKSDLSELNTKQRILEASMNLFALKGYDGASIREIAKLADVNVASLNYHFKSKENLRQELMEFIVGDFKNKIATLPEVKSTAEFAVQIYDALSEDSAKCLNQFKLILESNQHPCETEAYPVGYEQFSAYLSKELVATVPMEERMWLVNVVFTYVVHTAVMSATGIGQKAVEKFFPKKKASIPHYISQLVESLVRDLNQRYKK